MYRPTCKTHFGIKLVNFEQSNVRETDVTKCMLERKFNLKLSIKLTIKTSKCVS